MDEAESETCSHSLKSVKWYGIELPEVWSLWSEHDSCCIYIILQRHMLARFVSDLKTAVASFSNFPNKHILYVILLPVFVFDILALKVTVSLDEHPERFQRQ